MIDIAQRTIVGSLLVAIGVEKDLIDAQMKGALVLKRAAKYKKPTTQIKKVMSEEVLATRNFSDPEVRNDLLEIAGLKNGVGHLSPSEHKNLALNVMSCFYMYSSCLLGINDFLGAFVLSHLDDKSKESRAMLKLTSDLYKFYSRHYVYPIFDLLMGMASSPAERNYFPFQFQSVLQVCFAGSYLMAQERHVTKTLLAEMEILDVQTEIRLYVPSSGEGPETSFEVDDKGFDKVDQLEHIFTGARGLIIPPSITRPLFEESLDVLTSTAKSIISHGINISGDYGHEVEIDFVSRFKALPEPLKDISLAKVKAREYLDANIKDKKKR